MVAGLAFCVAQIGKPSFFGQITTRKAVEDSRKEALRSGAKLYSGQSCGKCGSSVRYASNNKCRDCHKAVIAARKKACEYRGIETKILSAKQASEARKLAMEQGRKYYNGRPCYRCGGTSRLVTTSVCAACNKNRVR